MDELKSKNDKNIRWRSERHKNKYRNLIRRTLLLVGSLFILFLIAYTTILYGGKLIVDEEKLVVKGPSTIETVNGDIIWNLYDEYRIPISLEEIPKHVQNAFISIEDRRFYDHRGVDYRSIMRAVYRDIVARSKVEGASTITQQLAKNLFLTNDKSWLRKTKEVMVALYLERELKKDDILELYLNAIYFGQGQYGIEAASQKYFSKTTSELTIEEGALLAGIVKAPNGYSPIEHPEKAKTRRDLVIKAMYELEMITEEEKNEALNKDLNLNVSVRKIDPSVQSFVDLVLKEIERYHLSIEQLKQGGYKLIVTINPVIQQIVYEQFKEDSYFPGNNLELIEGAFAMINKTTGAIVATVGARDYRIGDLNRVEIERQPGSTFKPIAVYAPAFMQGDYEPYTLIPDQPLKLDDVTIRNANDSYEGAVSIYNAIVQSKNSPAVWLLDQIGVDYAKSFLERMGMSIEDQGLAIALGGLKRGVSPISLVESYRTFASDGEYVPSFTIKEIYNYDGKLIGKHEQEYRQVFSKQVAWTMTEILKSVIESGTGKAGYYKNELAGKTGTTEHPLVEGYAKDAWFVGYTPDYVMALWMGYDRATEENYLLGGSSYPTELTKKILTLVDEKISLTAKFSKPDDVKHVVRPIELPVINDVMGKTIFGGINIVQGELTWTPSSDERIVYRIYKVNDSNIDERIGEVIGKGMFVVKKTNLFKKESFYVVPFDPLTRQEGNPSNIVSL